MHVVDLNIEQPRRIHLSDGSAAEVRVLSVETERDALCGAVRAVRVTVCINGQTAVLASGNYHLPRTVGGVQIDCPVTRDYYRDSGSDRWKLRSDVRLRLWPKDSPWIDPERFGFPIRQCWFASMTQAGNEPTYVNGDDGPQRGGVYYHAGVDIGGVEGEDEVCAAAEGVLVSVGSAALADDQGPAKPRHDVIYIRDDDGWYYRYSHLREIDSSLTPGRRVSRGRRLAKLGKEGGSGGWAHLHFGIHAPMPGGEYAEQDAYAFLWQAYQHERQPSVIAVARPHVLASVGEPVTLDAGRSWAARGAMQYQWTLTDGRTMDARVVQTHYDRPGMYSEILRVTDPAGSSDWDFAVVQVCDPDHPGVRPPTIHAAYYPTRDLGPGRPVTFAARSFRVDPNEGIERWDFGDGSDPIETQSDGNADVHAPDGYAFTEHTYDRPGEYLVTVQRTNRRGETATARLHLHVE